MSDLFTLTPATPAKADADSFTAVELVLRYWDSLREGRAMPARAEVEPQALARALEFMFIAEPVAPRVAKLRLAGQHLNALLGMEPRGMPLCALFAGPDRDELGLAVEQVVRHGARVVLPVSAETGIGRPALKGQLALMPLAGPDGRISRVLGALQTRGSIGRTPRKLTLNGPARELPVTPSRPDPMHGRPRLTVIQGGLSGA